MTSNLKAGHWPNKGLLRTVICPLRSHYFFQGSLCEKSFEDHFFLEYNFAMDSEDNNKNKIPVTIITGYLGSGKYNNHLLVFSATDPITGKTTLLNHLLSTQHDLRLAIIENEFGEIGIDDQLIQKRNRIENSSEEIIELMNGCVCCTVRKDLIEIIKKLLKMKGKKGKNHKKPFDAIVIETTGLADPAPVAQTFFVDDEVSSQCKLDAIVTVVDAKHIIQHLDEIKPEGVENESVEQVAFADRIVLNKIDLVTDTTEIAMIKARLRGINSMATIIESDHSRVDPNLLLGINGFSLERILKQEPEFLAEDGGDHQHDPHVSSVSLSVDFPLSIFHLENSISMLLREKAADLFRYKGIINVKGMDQRFIFQGVHMIFQGTFADPWISSSSSEDTEKDDSSHRISKFVFIGRDLDKESLTKLFLSCRAEEELRFPIGSMIFARTKGYGDFASSGNNDLNAYEAGVVIKHWDEGNPYRIRLNRKDEDGEVVEVWAPADLDLFIRQA